MTRTQTRPTSTAASGHLLASAVVVISLAGFHKATGAELKAPSVAPLGRADAPTILVLMQKSAAGQATLQGMRDELQEDFNLVPRFLRPGTTPDDLSGTVSELNPHAVVLMSNPAVRLFRRYQDDFPNQAVMPAIALLTSNLRELSRGIENLTGIVYEVPLVTSLVNLRAILNAPLRRVGVVHRPSYRGFLREQQRLAAAEGFTLVRREVSGRGTAMVRRAIERLQEEEKVDAIWVLNDNALLSRLMVVRAWIPSLQHNETPVVVNVGSLLSSGATFGTFAVLPDHRALGNQAGALMMRVASGGWTTRRFELEYPVSVEKELDLEFARRHLEIDEAELTDVRVIESVAALRETSLREAPGIVSVVTRDEMIDWGARDLIDVLRMVPGFFFGVDVQGVVGIGIRGHWANEGKVLLLVDGHEINELDFQTLQLGHHFPVEMLERIEIIRGPGSAIYGGNAELGVIQVVTRNAEQLEGARFSVRHAPPEGFYGGNGDTAGFLDVTAEAGMTHGDFSWTLGAFVGRSVRSDDTYRPLVDTPYDMGSASQLRPLLLRGSVIYRGFQARAMYDGYTLESKDAFDATSESVVTYRHGGVYVELSNDFTLSNDITLTPQFSYKRQESWFTEFEEGNLDQLQELVDEGLYLQRALQRVRGGATVTWDAFDEAHVLLGIEGFYDRGDLVDEDRDPNSPVFIENGYFDDNGVVTDKIDFFTTAVFGQFLWPNPIVNVTVGGRAEFHNVFGAVAAPRLALTKVFGFGLHAKLLAAQAFRTPSFSNKSAERAVDPDNRVSLERTTVFEAEVGYLFGEGIAATANGFVTLIDDPLIYFFDEESEEETYFNRDQTATAGWELQLQWDVGRVLGLFTYSYYQRLGDPIVDYEVPGRRALLGGPRHKLTARVRIAPLDWLRITPTLSWSLDRFGYVDNPDDVARLPNEALLGLAATARDVGTPGFDLGIAAHDLLGHGEAFPQPYFGGHGVLPGRGRQIMLRMSYRLER